MYQDQSQTVTRLLQEAREGDAHAFDALYSQVYDELRQLARVVRRGRGSETLSTTALVHEAYIRLLPAQDLAWQDRAHFFRVAARAMRQILIDAARRRFAAKRGGGAMAVTFDEGIHSDMQIEDVLALDDALKQLENMDARQAQVVEYRLFAGLTVEETAQLLGVGPATVKRDWRVARAWLVNALGQA